MSNYVGVSRERLFQVLSTDVAATPDATKVPLVVLSPRSSRGLPTTGLALVLLAIPPPNGINFGTPASATAPGFTLTLYRAIPTAAGGWAKLQAFAGANFGDQLVLPDISGGLGLYVQIGNVAVDGVLLVGLAELD